MKKKTTLTNRPLKRKKGKNGSSPFHTLLRLGSILLKSAIVLTVAVVISFVLIAGYKYFLESPHLRLEEVKVMGVEESLGGNLLRIAGLHRGMSLLGINLRRVKIRMESHPWIRSVRVERHFPNRLSIRAEKQDAVAVVVLDGTYYMNREGECFKRADARRVMDLPIITGVPVGNPGGAMERGLIRGLEIIEILERQRSPWSDKELSEIHLNKGERRVSIYFEHFAGKINAGLEDLEEKMGEFNRVLAYLSRTGSISNVEEVNLNYPRGVVVSFGKG